MSPPLPFSKPILSLLCLIVTCCSWQCGSSDVPDCEGGTTFVSAKIGGVLADGEVASLDSEGPTFGSVRDGNAVILQGTDGDRTISLFTNNFAGEGAYEIGGRNSEWSADLSIISVAYWSSETAPIGSGEIIITKDCDSYLEGSFRFVAETAAGSQADIMDGSFLVNF